MLVDHVSQFEIRFAAIPLVKAKVMVVLNSQAKSLLLKPKTTWMAHHLITTHCR